MRLLSLDEALLH